MDIKGSICGENPLNRPTWTKKNRKDSPKC